jgi:hypothetical protein
MIWYSRRSLFGTETIYPVSILPREGARNPKSCLLRLFSRSSAHHMEVFFHQVSENAATVRGLGPQWWEKRRGVAWHQWHVGPTWYCPQWFPQILDPDSEHSGGPKTLKCLKCRWATHSSLILRLVEVSTSGPGIRLDYQERKAEAQGSELGITDKSGCILQIIQKPSHGAAALARLKGLLLNDRPTNRHKYQARDLPV